MRNRKMKKVLALGCTMLLMINLCACGKMARTEEPGQETVSEKAAPVAGILDGGELFTERDREQEAELNEAQVLTVSDGQTLRITEEGVYLLRGRAAEATVLVEAGESDKIQLVLDGLHITNTEAPCIYVKNADKVFVTTAADSSLSVNGSVSYDGDSKADGAVFSRCDLVLNGTGALEIRSVENGVVCKDDLKITGGSYTIEAGSKCLEANDSIRVAGGSFRLKAGTDALHAENDEDDSLGYIYVAAGKFDIDAGDDGIHAHPLVQIDGGDFIIHAAEGIEGTYVQINSGSFSIQASDDGINAARKSGATQVCVEINGGDIGIVMGPGDTDGIDANGDLIINGGNVNISGSSGFDYEGLGQLNGGTVILNGDELSSLPNQMMGGPGMGGPGGHGGGPGMGGGPGNPPDNPPSGGSGDPPGIPPGGGGPGMGGRRP